MIIVRNFDKVLEIVLPDFTNCDLPAYLGSTLLMWLCDMTLSEPALDECEAFLCFEVATPTQNTEINVRLIMR